MPGKIGDSVNGSNSSEELHEACGLLTSNSVVPNISSLVPKCVWVGGGGQQMIPCEWQVSMCEWHSSMNRIE